MGLMDLPHPVVQFLNLVGVVLELAAQLRNLRDVADDGDGADNPVVEDDRADVGDVFDVADLAPDAEEGFARFQDLRQTGAATDLFDPFIQDIPACNPRQSQVGRIDVLDVSFLVGDQDPVVEGVDYVVEQGNRLQGVQIEFQRRHGLPPVLIVL